MSEDNYTRITLRVPKDLLQQVSQAALNTSKSQNAEIVARLRASFENKGALPDFVQQAVHHEQEERGGTEEEALIRLVQTAIANGGTLFHAVITPQTTIARLQAMLKASETVIPPDASIIMERKNVKPD